MNKLEPKVECSKELLQFFNSNKEDPSVWNKIQRALFMFCVELSKEEIFLAFIYGQGILQENPFQLRRQYQDTVLRTQFALDAVCSQRALHELLVALERSGNEAIISQVLGHVRIPQNNTVAVVNVTEPVRTDETPTIRTEPATVPHPEHDIMIVMEQLTDSLYASLNQRSRDDQSVTVEGSRQELHVPRMKQATGSKTMTEIPGPSREVQPVVPLTESPSSNSSVLQCPHCEKTFRRRGEYNRHVAHNHYTEYCDICNEYRRKDNFNRHRARCAKRFAKILCMTCGKFFSDSKVRANHHRSCR